MPDDAPRAARRPRPAAGEPPVKARPAAARTITGATLTWRVRESFIRYIASGEGTTRLARRHRRRARGARGRPAAGLRLPLPVRRRLVRPGHRRRAGRVHRHGRVPLRRPRDRPGGQRPRGRARRAGLARDLPHDRLRRHRRAATSARSSRRSTSPRPRPPATATPSPTSGSRAPSRRAPPAPSSPATTSRAIRSGRSRSPSPLPERTHAHVHPRARRRGAAGGRRRPPPPPTSRSPAASSTGRWPTSSRAAATRRARGSATRPTPRRWPGRPPTGKRRADRARDADQPDRRAVTVIDARLAARRSTQLYTLSYPVAAAGGTLHATTGVGSVELTGTLHVHRRTASRSRSSTRWSRSTALTGTLAASGTATDRGRSTAPFDRSKTRSSRSTSPTPPSRCAPNGARTINGHRPGQHRRHRARGLRRQLAPLRHDEPDARPDESSPTPGRRGRP